MKKLVYYLIFLLALFMMMLACSACRSSKTMTCSRIATDSVNLSFRDSTTQHFSFTFDSLELWWVKGSDPLTHSEGPKFQSPGNSHHMVVYGGKIQTATTTLTSQDSTSTQTTQDSKATRIRPSPTSLLTPHFSLLILFALAIVLFFLIRLRSSS